jgi:hypothetical protein
MPDENEFAPKNVSTPLRATGYGPARVLALALVFAFLVGVGGFVASRTVARDRTVVAPMCIDSQCTAAMSADSSSSTSMSATDKMSMSDGMMSESDVLGRAIDDLLKLLHLR